MDVAIIKYNAGNIYSVDYALKRLGVTPISRESMTRSTRRTQQHSWWRPSHARRNCTRSGDTENLSRKNGRKKAQMAQK